MKIVSFNTLNYRLSNGQSSHRDQIKMIQEMIAIENPDVAVLLEMPNPRQAVDGSNIAVMQHLQMFEQWLSVSAGYHFQRKIDDELSVWIVSKKQLIPLLLLGSETIAGATSRIFKLGQSELFTKRITGTSDYLDCIASMMCAIEKSPDDDRRPKFSHPAFGYNPPHGKDRSICVGVVDDEVFEQKPVGSATSSPNDKKRYCRRVLPLVATHAKCLFNNDRFGRLLSTFCRAAVVRKGVVVGDMNFGMTSKDDRRIEETDPRLGTELQPGTLDRFVKLPLGSANKEPSEATCQQISFPYSPLNIDGVFAPEELGIRVGAPRSVYDPDFDQAVYGTNAAICPTEEFPSDHKWVVFNVPHSAMIDVPVRANSIAAVARRSIMDDTVGHADFIDARYVCHAWSQSHRELFGLFENPITVVRPPLPENSNEQGDSESNQSRNASPVGSSPGGNNRSPGRRTFSSNNNNNNNNVSSPLSPSNNGTSAKNQTATTTTSTTTTRPGRPISPRRGSPQAENQPRTFSADNNDTQRQARPASSPRNNNQNGNDDDGESTSSPNSCNNNQQQQQRTTSPYPSNLCPRNNIGECTLGANCPFAHRECKFGDRCRRPVCHFGHPASSSAKKSGNNFSGLNPFAGEDATNNSAPPPGMSSREGTKKPF